MKLLAYLFRSSPYIAVLAVVAALVSGLSNAGLITLIHSALNLQSGISPMGLPFIGLAVLGLITSIVSQIMLSYLYRKAVFDWQMRLSQEILRAPLRQLENIGSPELLAVLVEDVLAIGGALLPMLPFCSNVVVAAVCLAYLWWLSWPMFIGLMSLILLGGMTYQFIWRRSQAMLKRARQESGRLYKHFQNMTGGMKELKLHRGRRKAFFNTHLKPTAAARQRQFFIWGMLHAVNQAWAKFLLLFAMGVILFALPHIIPVNRQILTGYILTLLYIRSLLFSLMAAMPAFSQADIAFQKIQSLGLRLNQDAMAVEEIDSVKVLPPWQTLELADVSHTYYRESDDRHFTLGPIDLKFQPGELVFLLGGNGSGKTTLAKLITGLYLPESGGIYLNGELITEANQEEYLQLFSVVFADFQLFNDLLGLDVRELDAKAQEYLVKLQLEHKVQIHDGNLSTTALSGGQRQRLALLTAYLEDRPFYIFDEWAANQDPTFKEIFYTQFLPELKARGKTILVISHDDRYFHLADRVIKLDYGKLAKDYAIPSAEPSIS